METEASQSEFETGNLSFGSDDPVQEPKTDVSEPVTNGNPFLNEVNPQHRSIVAPYLKKWDANATKKFQDYSARLKPWESIGMPIEEVQRYLAVASKLRDNPEEIFRLIWDGLQDQFGDSFEEELARILEVQEQMSEEEYDEEFDGSEEEIDETNIWQRNVETELDEIKAWREEQAQLAEESEQEAQLDELLTNMHKQFGNFDEDYMLLMLSRHQDVAKAVKAYNEFVTSISRRTPRQVPKTMGGQGGVPNGQVNVNKLRGADRKKAVEAFLEGAAE